MMGTKVKYNYPLYQRYVCSLSFWCAFSACDFCHGVVRNWPCLLFNKLKSNFLICSDTNTFPHFILYYSLDSFMVKLQIVIWPFSFISLTPVCQCTKACRKACIWYLYIFSKHFPTHEYIDVLFVKNITVGALLLLRTWLFTLDTTTLPISVSM